MVINGHQAKETGNFGRKRDISLGIVEGTSVTRIGNGLLSPSTIRGLEIQCLEWDTSQPTDLRLRFILEVPAMKSIGGGNAVSG
jgi:hypothetical protein